MANKAWSALVLTVMTYSNATGTALLRAAFIE